MKISFLQLQSHDGTDAARAVVAHANALARRHNVEVISVARTSSSARHDLAEGVRQRDLATVSDEVWRQAAREPSSLVPQRWDPAFHAGIDQALEAFLPTVKSGVLVTTTPGLLAAVAGRVSANVRLVHLDLTPLDAGAEALEALKTFGCRATAVVTPTTAKAGWLQQQLGGRAVVHAVPVPVPDVTQPRSRLDQPLILAGGPLDGDKRHVAIVEAFARIAAEIPEWRLRILGSGSQNRLIRAARRFSLYDRLELLGDTPDAAVEWAKASVSTVTSRWETAPVAVQTSFAAGVPVVAYDCPTGPSEFIEHGRNGYLVREGHVDGLAQRLLSLAQDRELRQKMGAAAHESAERFSRAAVAQLWDELFVAAEQRPQLIRTGGRRVHNAVAGRPPAITPAQSRAELVATTASNLKQLRGWFVLPARGDFPPTFVIPAEQQRETLDLLATASYPAHVSLSVGEGDHWLWRRGSVAETVGQLAAARLNGFDLEPWPQVEGEVTHLAHRAGIRIEFWTRDADGCLNAPSANPYFNRVHESDVADGFEVEGCPVPGIPAIAGPFIEQCTFPVDLVYTWVDDSDPVWQESRRRAEAAAGRDLLRKEASGAARFRNRDELRYSLRSIHAHAPWVRTIHLVTAGQRPAWLEDHPKVKVVDHREILPADALPNFNSHAIETGLHKVPGLSEHYIYFNDDVFLGRPLGPERFFSAGGNYAAFISERALGLEGRDDRPFVRAGLNNRQLLQDRLGITNTHTVAHTPHPMRKTVVEKMCEEFSAAVDRTSRSPFRSPEDVSVTASLAQHYGVATGAAHLGDLDLGFVDTSRINARSRLRELLSREREAFCLGDHHDYALREEKVNEILADFFERYFPVRPPWERPD